MARVLLLPDQLYDKVYVVDYPVGMGLTNASEDVRLVQYFLAVAWEDAPTSKGFRPPGATMPPKRDGIYGPITQKFITYFQEEAKRRGAPVLQDKRVDPVRSGTSTTTLSNTFYTILAMNAASRSRRGDNHDLKSDPLFPKELMKSFYVFW